MTPLPTKLQYQQAVDIEYNERAMNRANGLLDLARKAHVMCSHYLKEKEHADKFQFDRLVKKYAHRHDISTRAYYRVMAAYYQTLLKVVTAKARAN